MLDPERAVLVERGDAFGGGTNCGLPGVVVALTNSRMAFLAGPSFQEGSGSVCASACGQKASEAARISARAGPENVVIRFIGPLLSYPDFLGNWMLMPPKIWTAGWPAP